MQGKQKSCNKRGRNRSATLHSGNFQGNQINKRGICSVEEHILKMHEALMRSPEIAVSNKRKIKKRAIVVGTSREEKTFQTEIIEIQKPFDHLLIINRKDFSENSRVIN